MGTRLLHYSAEKFTGPVHSVPAEKQMVTMKPDGLWVSVEGEDDWQAWCEAESFRLDRLENQSEIYLRPDANVLFLCSCADIDALDRDFGAEPFPELRTSLRYIDWRQVAERYQGIIIAPYQWSRRFDGDARWYYSWDCASGCIWDADAIESIHVLESATCT